MEGRESYRKANKKRDSKKTKEENKIKEPTLQKQD